MPDHLPKSTVLQRLPLPTTELPRLTQFAPGVKSAGVLRKLPVRRRRLRPAPIRCRELFTRGTGALLPLAGLAWGSFFPGNRNCFSLFLSRIMRPKAICCWRRGDGAWGPALGAGPGGAGGAGGAAGGGASGKPPGKENP